MRDSKQQWETVRDSQQLHRIRDTVRCSKQTWENVRDMQQLHGTDKDSERKPVTIGNSERHVANPWHWERKLENASNNERQ